MRVTFHLLFVTACVLADKDEDRRSKLPFVADAVGNALPPPSSVPASVGSPVNLLTPDRYEFYTFDESGELVKRLMTLEEIQAIVAAGEEGNSMVTFADDDQPTVAFNFSQPPSNKVHSVVTNVQNVLKAQMEAHKNKPLVQPTLDTPDVSDSWSLILPSIFGNTGVDIVPDKSSGSFTTPETETLEIDVKNDIYDSLSKEGDQKINTTTTQEEINVTEKSVIDTNKVKDDINTVSETSSPSTVVFSSPTTTSLPSSATAVLSKKPISSTLIMTDSTTVATPRLTTTTVNPSTTTPSITSTTTTSTTAKPKNISTTSTTTTSTTAKPRITSTTSTITTSTTAKPRTTSTTSTTTTSTTPKPTITKVSPSTAFKITTTTFTPELSTKNHFANVGLSTYNVKNDISDTITSSEKDAIFEKLSTFVPVSTMKYVTERITHKPSTTAVPTVITQISVSPSKLHNIQSTTNIISTLPYVSSTSNDSELKKMNVTTITTQSVSPSTTVSSTEIAGAGNTNLFNNIMDNKPVVDNNMNSEIKDDEPLIPLFDVAQSISQIASDLGGDFKPIPTVTNLLDTSQILEENFESKENTNMGIPTADEVDTKSQINNESNNEDNFVKISTLDPHPEKEEEKLHVKEVIKPIEIDAIPENNIEIETTTILVESTTLDPILNESMDDLISQVVNEAPQHYLDSESGNNISTTEQFIEAITESKLNLESTSEIFTENNTNTTDTTEKILEEAITTTFSNKITTEKAVIENINQEDLIPNINDLDNMNLKEYIQISVSDNKSESETATGVFDENDFATDIPINEQDNADNDVKNNIHNNDILNLETTTIQLELTTIISNFENINGISSKIPEHINSVKEIINRKTEEENIEKQGNISNSTPKIEEYKKKIQKVNIAEEELENIPNNSWKRIPTVSQTKNHGVLKDKVKAENHYTPEHTQDKDIVLDYSKENQGLEVTTKDLSEDVEQFTELCNELAFRYWNVMIENVDKKRSFVMSPYSITSMLAMMFMGARGATSGEMNEILKLDEMVTFNPHFTLKNISDSIEMHQGSGIAVSAFIRELYSDRNKGKILTFYKERAQHFYNGHVEEINFKLISDIIRRRTNLLVKRYSWGKISEYMKTNTIVMQPPLAAFSANIFQTDCTGSSVGGRDGEMYFVVSPNVRQRRLVPVPAVVYKNNFLAGYDPVLDATAAALGNTNSIVSTLFVMPGQQGNVVHPEDLEKLEQRLIDANPTTPAWKRLLRTLLPRIGLELQIPRFSHKSVSNVSSSLRKMGLKDLFDAEHADLGGLNGPSKDLYLSDMVQMTNFVTCGEDVIGDQHHVEEYPESLPAQRRRTSRWTSYWDEPRDYQRAFHDPHDVGEAMNLPLHLRPRQARVPSRNVQPARLKFDRPFLYFTRHNPTGMILYVGRYNPRLLP